MKPKNIFLAVVLVCTTSGAFADTSNTSPTPLITQSAETLLGVLKSGGSRKEKADACRELAVIGTSQVVPELVGLLADDELSHMARYALETIPASGVDRALRSELPRLKGRALVGVIGSLGVRRDSQAVKPLSRLLGNTDPEVAQAAARALGNIGTPDAARAIEKALPKTVPANRLAFCEGLFRCAEAFTSKGKTKDAITLYDRLRGLTAVPDQVRAGALRGGIVARGQGGLGLLKEFVTSRDPVLFDAAIRASLEMSGSEVTQVLAASLPQIQPANQIVVMQALGSRGDDSAVPALATQARMGDKMIRVTAIRAVAAIGHTGSVLLLVELIGDPENAISQEALEGLAGITGREADAAVLNLLKNPEADRRINGIELAGRRRMVAAVPELLVAAADSKVKVRSSAYQRLAKLGAPAEVPTLIQLLLHSTETKDLEGLADALSGICTRAGSPASATEQIIGALSGAHPAQQAALLGVLGFVAGEKALVSVRASLNNPDADVRDAAVRALAEWPDAAAAPDLLRIVRSATDRTHRAFAFRGYVRLACESSGPVAQKLKWLDEAGGLSISPQEKMLVLAGLGDIPTVESLRLAMVALSDPAVADEAGAVAVKIAEKLDVRDSADIGMALNQVLKSVKSPQVLDKARKRMDQLNLSVH